MIKHSAWIQSLLQLITIAASLMPFSESKKRPLVISAKPSSGNRKMPMPTTIEGWRTPGWAKRKRPPLPRQRERRRRRFSESLPTQPGAKEENSTDHRRSEEQGEGESKGIARSSLIE